MTRPGTGTLYPGLLGVAVLCLACGSATAAVIDYASRLGETAVDRGLALALDAQGNRYVAGSLQAGPGRGTDILIAKLDPGGELLALQALGAGGDDLAHVIAVDAIGRIYIAGETDSVTLPPVPGGLSPVQADYGGAVDGFLAILDVDLELLSMSHIGGAGFDTVLAMSLDDTGAIYLAGSTASDDLPGVGADSLQSQRGNGGEATDAFILKLAPGGESIVYASYLGGDAADSANAIAVDAAGQIFIAGVTASRDFPVAGPAFQPAHGGAIADAFVARLNPAATDLVFSTFLGGGALDGARALAVDADGDVYVGGYTSSMEVLSPDTNDIRGFPLSEEPAQNFNGGGIADAFVSRIAADGSELRWSTYFGGADHEEATSIAIDTDGRVTIGGFSANNVDSPRGGGLTLSRALQFRPLGDSDGFLAQFDADGALLLSTWLGGSDDDSVNAIAVRDGSVHVVGTTNSADFFARGAVLHGLSGDFGDDAFLMELDVRMAEDELPDLSVEISNDPMPVPVNDIAVFEIATSSDQPSDVSGAMVLVSLAGASLATPLDPSCRLVNEVSAVCDIADASGGDTITVRADPRAIGSLRMEAALLRVDQADRSMDNNTAASTLTIVDTSGGRGASGGTTIALLALMWLLHHGLRRRSLAWGNAR
ncbi:MAG: hypothetical protein RBT81_09020 [Gammaproteobacteria bacterium]|jgi:hypothetical protein|nr:hypothetical protein [Gammaproteobacteria bacterium]